MLCIHLLFRFFSVPSTPTRDIIASVKNRKNFISPSISLCVCLVVKRFTIYLFIFFLYFLRTSLYIVHDNNRINRSFYLSFFFFSVHVFLNGYRYIYSSYLFSFYVSYHPQDGKILNKFNIGNKNGNKKKLIL